MADKMTAEEIAKIKDLTGQKFGRLTVIGFAEIKSGNAVWNCKCDCGNTTTARGYSLKNRHIQSCGCYKRDKLSKYNINCGLKGTRICIIYSNMKQRCYNRNHYAYHDYGGRGITICEEWMNNIQAFHDWALSHGYTDELTIDRIDNDGNYEPNNCKWSTRAEQQNNTRKSRNITYCNVTHTIAQWSELLKIPYDTIYYRVSHGWAMGRIINTPRKNINKAS